MFFNTLSTPEFFKFDANITGYHAVPAQLQKRRAGLTLSS
jgi:hypothetical protein